MAEALADLFGGDDNSALCDRLFVCICEVHGNGADASALSDEERTVYLVWGALGAIGNGGFRYLFESSVNGDPHYALTRYAFEQIGCDPAVAAFDRALGRFPGSRPPVAARKRLRLYLDGVPGTPAPEDREFYAAQGDIERCLGRWVRARQRGFTHLR